MPPTNLLPLNRTVQIETAVGQVLGFGFASAGSAAGEEAEVQRWIMFTQDLARDSFPRNWVRIKETAITGWKDIVRPDGPSGFIQKAKDVFIPGRDFYVVANCAFVQGDPIPASLPTPAFLPRDPGGSAQGFWGLAPIALSNALGVGVVYVEQINTKKRNEYWALFDTYRAPVGTVAVEVGKINALDGGNNFARVVEGTRWTATSTMAVCACALWDQSVPE